MLVRSQSFDFDVIADAETILVKNDCAQFNERCMVSFLFLMSRRKSYECVSSRIFQGIKSK